MRPSDFTRSADRGTAELRAPSSGKVVAIYVEAGETIVAGERIFVIEAMKMKHEIRTARDDQIEHIAVGIGNQVATHALPASFVGK